ALALVEEKICDQRQGLLRVNPAVIDEYLHPILDKTDAGEPIAKGLPASPGSAVGHAVFFAEQAVELAAQGIKTILIRNETTPEDIDGLKVAEGIITAHGGMTSHAAVVARGMGKCCVVGVGAIRIDYLINEMTVGEHQVQRMDWISMDGASGEIYAAELPQTQPELEGGIATVLEWADEVRRLGVYANADTAEDARHALEQGAGGIGLCRTEHMFFEIDRIPLFRKMILALDEIGRAAALAELLPLQRKDFMEIFRVMEDRPVTIRLLDPPLNEYLPKSIRSQTRMARAMGIPVETIIQRTEALSESNPMMGHRGCRLAITYPEIYNMQVRAIVEAACIVKKEGVQVNPEIMVPLVSTSKELSILRKDIERMVTQVTGELGETIVFKIGTMLETPRAAVSARSIARLADFFSFGTNDLTQMSYGFSRDDVGMFLPVYLEKGILDNDPFMELDREGTGRLVKIAVKEGREANPDLKLGVCGEHGGDPQSVKFFHQVGLDYVSCSPFRIPVARLAAGQAMVESQAD
ncbi:MAG: putative PEP-binding protein, partial [bacterium]